MISYLQKVLCALNIHSWNKWNTHPFYGNWMTRQCKRCFKIDDKRLF